MLLHLNARGLVNPSMLVKCPNCGKKVEWSEESRWRPFCCERCRLIDLGEWAEGERSIPGESVVPPDPDQDGH